MKQLEILDEIKVKLNDLDNQQKTGHLAIVRLEMGKGAMSGELPSDAILPKTHKTTLADWQEDGKWRSWWWR